MSDVQTIAPEDTLRGEVIRPGATGAYSDEAVLEQTLLGFHEHGGVKVRFQIPSM